MLEIAMPLFVAFIDTGFGKKISRQRKSKNILTKSKKKEKKNGTTWQKIA